MSETQEPDVFDELKEDASAWIRARLELIRLELTERFALVLASLISGGLFLVLVFFFLFFLLLATGFWLGEVWRSVPLGMMAVAGIVLLMLVAFALARKSLIQGPLTDAIIRKSLEHESSEKSQ
jgi:hypothetical protein